MSLNSDSVRTTARSMAVFIDADNLNDPTALDHVLLAIRSHADRVLYRRAYGRPESLKGIESVLWKHGVRPVANLIVDKVTTDSALVIDAVEAVCTSEIDTVAICSGDADFVPLALWLREKGKRVFCYSLSNKIFANPESFYDDIVLLDVVSSGQEATGNEVPTVRDQANAGKPSSSNFKLSSPGHNRTQTVPVTNGSANKASVKQILSVLPELKTNEPMHLSMATKRLREAKILGKSSSSPKLFSVYPAQFELAPKKQPNTVKYRG